MTYLVRGTFNDRAKAQGALDALMQAGFTPDQVAFRARYARSDTDNLAGRYQASLSEPTDRVAGALLSGRLTTSLSTTGYNLAGNSTLADTTLGGIPDLLAEIAEDDRDRDFTRRLRLDALVRTDGLSQAERARSILAESGGFHVTVQKDSKGQR